MGSWIFRESLVSAPFSNKGENMQKKLYVGGLSYNTDVDQVRELFVQAGEVVSANIIKDKFTEQSRGFGFVEMATEEQAAEAIKMFNGKELGGRTLTVNESRPQEKRNFSGRNDGGYKGKGGKRW